MSGQDDTAVRVRFADGEDQTLPLSWAESMLRKLHDDSPETFGRLIMYVVTEGRANGRAPRSAAR